MGRFGRVCIGRRARIGGNDLLVAAHARSLGLRLVTDRPEEFGFGEGVGGGGLAGVKGG